MRSDIGALAGAKHVRSLVVEENEGAHRTVSGAWKGTSNLEVTKVPDSRKNDGFNRWPRGCV